MLSVVLFELERMTHHTLSQWPPWYKMNTEYKKQESISAYRARAHAFGIVICPHSVCEQHALRIICAVRPFVCVCMMCVICVSMLWGCEILVYHKNNNQKIRHTENKRERESLWSWSIVLWLSGECPYLCLCLVRMRFYSNVILLYISMWCVVCMFTSLKWMCTCVSSSAHLFIVRMQTHAKKMSWKKMSSLMIEKRGRWE
jgi:hypothetical protein